jgi:hypothetical protein
VAVVGDCATTIAIGLAATWPSGEQTFVLEFDPSGGCASAWLDVPRQPGLSQLAASAESHTWGAIEASIQRSAAGVDVLVAPTRAVEASAAVAASASTVLPVLAAIDEVTAIADGGRLHGDISALAAKADIVVVAHRQHHGSAAAAAVGLERVADTCDALARRSVPHVVALVGDRPYAADEVAAFVGVAAVVNLAIDDWAAAVFSGRAASPSRLKRSPLWRSLSELSGVVSASLRSSRAAQRRTAVDATGPAEFAEVVDARSVVTHG